MQANTPTAARRSPRRFSKSEGRAPQRAPLTPLLLRESNPGLRGVPQALCLRERLELFKRVVLDLPDALPRDVERAPDLLKSTRSAACEAKTHLNYLTLALRQRRERTMNVLLAQVLGGQLERRLGRLVLDEVAQLGLLLVADRLLQRDRLLAHAENVADLARCAVQLGGDLLGRGLAAERLDELALDVHDLVELLDHMDRDPDRAALVGDGARHGLPDPPRRVGGELVPAPVVELLDRADEAERALLDEVQEGETTAEVA